MVTIEDLLQKPVSELTHEEFQKITAHKREQERKEKEEKRHAYEQLREETINELGPIAEKISKEIQEFKEKSFVQLGSLYELLQDYSNRHRDGKGNFEIKNEHYKILFKKQFRIGRGKGSNQRT